MQKKRKKQAKRAKKAMVEEKQEYEHMEETPAEEVRRSAAIVRDFCAVQIVRAKPLPKSEAASNLTEVIRLSQFQQGVVFRDFDAFTARVS